ncbi:MAG: phosphate ABC transporter permease subunit PstC [Phycisphaerae bacterium]
MTDQRPQPPAQPQIGTTLPGRSKSVRVRTTSERFIMAGLLTCGVLSLVTTIGIVAILGLETYRFFTFVEPRVRTVSVPLSLADPEEAEATRAAEAQAARDRVAVEQAAEPAEVSEVEPSAGEAPSDAPGLDTPGVDTPGVDAPGVDAPVAEAPPSENPPAEASPAEAAPADGPLAATPIDDQRPAPPEPVAPEGFVNVPLHGRVYEADGKWYFEIDERFKPYKMFLSPDQVNAIQGQNPERVGLPADFQRPAFAETIAPGDRLRLIRIDPADDKLAAALLNPRNVPAEADRIATLSDEQKRKEMLFASLRSLDLSSDAFSEYVIAEVEFHRFQLKPRGDSLSNYEDAYAQIWHDPVTPWSFLTGGRWNPLLGETKNFGIWPLVVATLKISAIAMMVALPLGLITAIWLSEYAPANLRAVIKPVLEVLAGIPTVVFGFFALTVITPGLQFFNRFLPKDFEFGVFNTMSAGLAVGILTLPIITSLTEDALRAVPRALREGSYGLGATKFETSLRVVTPAALSGIIAAFLLAVARAVGETMIVALAAGGTPLDLVANKSSLIDPTSQGQPMTGFMVQVFLGDVSQFGIEYFSSYAVAATLFVITLVLTVVGHQIRVKFRQVYE